MSHGQEFVSFDEYSKFINWKIARTRIYFRINIIGVFQKHSNSNVEWSQVSMFYSKIIFKYLDLLIYNTYLSKAGHLQYNLYNIIYISKYFP